MGNEKDTKIEPEGERLKSVNLIGGELERDNQEGMGL